MNRFELEDAMSNLHQIGEDIDTIIYAIGDCPIKHTEDQPVSYTHLTLPTTPYV